MSAAVFAWSSCGASSQAMETATVKMISVATTACQVKIVSVRGSKPSAKPYFLISSCTGPGLLSALATWSAAEPDSPCAQTVPSPRKAMAPSAR